MKQHIYTAAIGALVLCSCVSYQEAPVDMARDTAEWAQVSAALCKGGHLNREQMIKIGLLLNRELNQARLKVAKSTSVAEFAGLWEDPSVSFELSAFSGKTSPRTPYPPA